MSTCVDWPLGSVLAIQLNGFHKVLRDMPLTETYSGEDPRVVDYLGRTQGELTRKGWEERVPSSVGRQGRAVQ